MTKGPYTGRPGKIIDRRNNGFVITLTDTPGPNGVVIHGATKDFFRKA